MANPGATNSYGPGGGLSTTIQSRGMDIGPIPDFWGDLQQIKDRLRPVSRGIGGGQAQALRQPAYSTSGAREFGSEMANPANDELALAQKRAATIAALNPNGPTPGDFGAMRMNQTGNWGTFVDPANIPANLQDKIMGGMYG